MSCVFGVVFMFEHQDVPTRPPSIIVSPSTIDKMFEIYTFFENRTENLEHFVNGRWSQHRYPTHASPMKWEMGRAISAFEYGFSIHIASQTIIDPDILFLVSLIGVEVNNFSLKSKD